MRDQQGNQDYYVNPNRAGFNAMGVNMYIFTLCAYGFSQALKVELRRVSIGNYVQFCIYVFESEVGYSYSKSYFHIQYTNTPMPQGFPSSSLSLTEASLPRFIGEFKPEDHSSVSPENDSVSCCLKPRHAVKEKQHLGPTC